MAQQVQPVAKGLPVPARPGRFFALAFGISWAFWVPAALSGQTIVGTEWVWLLYVGGLGPALAEIVLLWRERSRAAWRDYWQRVFDVRRISGRWYLVIFLTVPAVSALAVAVDVGLGGTAPSLAELRSLIAQPWALLSTAVFLLAFGPIPEELGWRGYALDGLQARVSALSASLIIGVGWMLWHLPLFFMRGTFQHELGFGSSAFLWFAVGTVVVSVAFTWIYNNTGRSTLSAILFHFMQNVTGELVPLGERARLIQSMLWIILAVGIVWHWGPRHLMKRSQNGSVPRRP